MVAVDTTDAGIGDYVGYEDGMEATWPLTAMTSLQMPQ